MISKINHIGIAVSDLDEIREIYGKIMPEAEVSECEVASQKSRMLCYDVGGVHMEFLKPTSDDSPIAGFLAKRGQGIHHIALETDDVKADLDRLVGEGFRAIDKEPREGMNGTKIAFLHPKSTGSVLIELCEK